MKGALLALAVWTLAGCAAYHRPVVDLAVSGKTLSGYELDRAQCQDLASQASGPEAMGQLGAAVGAGLGAATAAILGGNAGTGAGLGARYGEVIGISEGVAIRAEAARRCMAGRGYSVRW